MAQAMEGKEKNKWRTPGKKPKTKSASQAGKTKGKSQKKGKKCKNKEKQKIKEKAAIRLQIQPFGCSEELHAAIRAYSP